MPINYSISVIAVVRTNTIKENVMYKQLTILAIAVALLGSFAAFAVAERFGRTSCRRQITHNVGKGPRPIQM